MRSTEITWIYENAHILRNYIIVGSDFSNIKHTWYLLLRDVFYWT